MVPPAVLRLLLAATMVALVCPPAHAQDATFDFAPRLAFGTDPTTQMTIVWNAPRDTTGHQFEYGLTADLGTQIKPTQRDLGAATTWPVYVKLEGLTPATEYHYRISMGDHQDETRRFRTATGESAPFSFLAWGDQSSPGAPESSGDASKRVVDLAQATEADFALIAGDLSYAGTNATWWDRYVEMLAPYASRHPVMTVPGNHDLDGGSLVYRTRFRMPTDGDDRWYQFRYGNAQFIGLDTESFCNDARDGSGAAPFKLAECPAGLRSQQLEFLENALKAARSDDAIDWVIVYHHYPVYSSGKHGGNQLLLKHWVPLYQTYGVNLVIAAHDHLYVRSKPIPGDVTSTTYVVVGTGGAQLYAHKGTPDWEAYYQDKNHGLLKVKVGADKIEGEWVAVGGEVFDSFVVGAPEAPLTTREPILPPIGAPSVTWAAVVLALGGMVLLRRGRV